MSCYVIQLPHNSLSHPGPILLGREHNIFHVQQNILFSKKYEWRFLLHVFLVPCLIACYFVMVLSTLMTVFVRLIESNIGKSTRSWSLSHPRVDAITEPCTYERCWIIFLITTKWQVLLVEDVNRKVISLEKMVPVVIDPVTSLVRISLIDGCC
jgi:hypothetical protein